MNWTVLLNGKNCIITTYHWLQTDKQVSAMSNYSSAEQKMFMYIFSKSLHPLTAYRLQTPLTGLEEIGSGHDMIETW